MIKYLTETLGIQYFPRPLLVGEESVNSSSIANAQLNPHPETKLLFILTDSKDLNWTSAHETVFQNMIKALELSPNQVYKHYLVDTSLIDYFSQLRIIDCFLPSVFFSQDPDISSGVKSLGSHSWVEIYSFSDMMKKTELKKLSWKNLQALQAKGF